MALRWEVSFVDDESDETQHAFFSSKREADTWIKNVEVQQRYEPTGFEVVDGPTLRENSMKILAEGKTLEQVKKMRGYPWGINDESIIRCEPDSLNESPNEDMQLVFESCNAAFGRQPSFAQLGEKYDEVTEGDFAYDVAKRCIRDGMTLDGVWSVNNGTYYVVSLFGGHNQSSLSRDAWVSYLQEVEQMVSNMLENGCGSVWLVSFMNDPIDDAWELRIGFDLLSSPFEDDK